MEKLKGFCPQLWQEVDVLRSGFVRPCCLFQGTLYATKTEKFSVHNLSLEQLSATPHLKMLKRQALAGELIPQCDRCYNIEEKGGTSRRQLKIDRAKQSDPGGSATDFVRRIGNVSQTAEVMLQLGNQCNFRCRMCKPADSSKIEADAVHCAALQHLTDKLYFGHIGRNQGDWFGDEKIMFARVYPAIAGATTISLVGGEPLLIPMTRRFLQRLVDDGCAGQKDLVITTNGSILSDRWLDLLIQFRLVTMNVSVDASGDQLEYIRHGAKWPMIDRNIRQLKRAGIYVNICASIQVYNVLSLLDLCRYAIDVSALLVCGWVDQPKIHNPEMLPRAIRSRIVERLSAQVNENDLSDSMRQALLYACRRISFSNVDEPTYLNGFVQFTRLLDEDRGESFSGLFPELSELLAYKPLVSE